MSLTNVDPAAEELEQDVCQVSTWSLPSAENVPVLPWPITSMAQLPAISTAMGVATGFVVPAEFAVAVTTGAIWAALKMVNAPA